RNETRVADSQTSLTGMKFFHPVLALLVCISGYAPLAHGGGPVRVRTSTIPSFEALLRQPLSLEEALNIAAEQNSRIRAAKADVLAHFGVAIQVRAIVFPKVIASADYVIRQDSLIEQNQNRKLPEFKLP